MSDEGDDRIIDEWSLQNFERSIRDLPAPVALSGQALTLLVRSIRLLIQRAETAEWERDHLREYVGRLEAQKRS